jgi:hypothetical protein
MLLLSFYIVTTQGDLRQIVGEVIRGRMDRKAAAAYITAWVENNGIPEPEREKFRNMAARLVVRHLFYLVRRHDICRDRERVSN